MRESELGQALQVYDRVLLRRRPAINPPTRTELDSFHGSVYAWCEKKGMEQGDLLARLTRNSNLPVMPCSTVHPTGAAQNLVEKLRWRSQPPLRGRDQNWTAAGIEETPFEKSPLPWLPLDVIGSFLVVGHYNPYATDYRGLPEPMLIKVILPSADYHRILATGIEILRKPSPQFTAEESRKLSPPWAELPDCPPKDYTDWLHLLLYYCVLEGHEQFIDLSKSAALEKLQSDKGLMALLRRKLAHERMLPTSSLMPTMNAFELLPRRKSLNMPALCYFASGNTRYVLLTDSTLESGLQDELNQGADSGSINICAVQADESEIRRLTNILSGSEVMTLSDGLEVKEDEATELVRLDAHALALVTQDDLKRDQNDPDAAKRITEWWLHRAIVNGASDIHLFPCREGGKVQIRVHGVLRTIAVFPLQSLSQFNALLKIWCKKDIAETRMPQDGGFTVRMNKLRVECRVSLIPTIYGIESAVVRLFLDNNITLERMNLSKDQMWYFDEVAASPNGIFLVTGETGSGKTTTLNAFMTYIRNDESSFVTVEDPVERHVDGFKQFEINDKIGLDFARILRGVLRHDPDKVLLGEIRDQDSAKLAVQFANTGHLVMATLHTNSSLGSIARLRSYGLAPEHIASAVICLQAQTLHRSLCNCAERGPISDEERRIIVNEGNIQEERIPDYLMRKKGCVICHGSGYSGRHVAMEFCPVTPELAELIAKEDVSEGTLLECARAYGYRNLYEESLELVLRGITTLEEVRHARRPFSMMRRVQGRNAAVA